MNITILGPIMMGSVIGWIIYYFIRQFTFFSPATLASTIAAFVGGPILKYLNPEAVGGRIQSLYFLGIAIGFFGYAGYLGLLLLFVATGKLNKDDFEFYAGSGGIRRQERQFLQTMQAVQEFSDGKIDEATLEKRSEIETG